MFVSSIRQCMWQKCKAACNLDICIIVYRCMHLTVERIRKANCLWSCFVNTFTMSSLPTFWTIETKKKPSKNLAESVSVVYLCTFHPTQSLPVSYVKSNFSWIWLDCTEKFEMFLHFIHGKFCKCTGLSRQTKMTPYRCYLYHF